MPVPKRKTSKARRNNRNANKNVTASSFMDCKNCGNVCMPHQVCKSCGFYKGIKVMVTKLDRSMTRGESRKTKSDAMAVRAQAAAPVAEPVEVEAEEVKATPKKAVAKKAAPKKAAPKKADSEKVEDKKAEDKK
jgi:large subunit ribosomal protein L32